MGALKMILHPTDFSESSNNAFVWACSLARENHAKLIILHVMLPSSAPLFKISSPSSVPLAESPEDLESPFPWPKPPPQEIVVEHRVVEGDTATEILRFAATAKCDMIVLGTHGRTGLSRLLTGSVAEQVLRTAACPVMVIKDLPKDAAVTETAAPGKAGEVVEMITMKSSQAGEQSLVKGEDLEVIQLVLPAGQEIERQRSSGELVIHCLSGQIALTAMNKKLSLAPGQVICLPRNQSFSIKCLEDASVLMTNLLPK